MPHFLFDQGCGCLLLWRHADWILSWDRWQHKADRGWSKHPINAAGVLPRLDIPSLCGRRGDEEWNEAAALRGLLLLRYVRYTGLAHAWPHVLSSVLISAQSMLSQHLATSQRCSSPILETVLLPHAPFVCSKNYSFKHPNVADEWVYSLKPNK